MNNFDATTILCFLKNHIHYDEYSGELTWINRPKHTAVNVGDRAGCEVKGRGYRTIGIKGNVYLEHRIVWLINHGDWPEFQIDHINGNRSDNRIENLRVATIAENAQNRVAYRNSKSGLIGVAKVKGYELWGAKIVKNGKRSHLGYFKDPYSAHLAYVSAKREIHDFNPVVRHKDIPA